MSMFETTHATPQAHPVPVADLAATYVTFDLAGQTFGVDVRYVREILDRVEISLLPNSPPGIEGMIDVRGESVPIMDLGSRLGLHRDMEGEDTRIIVLELKRTQANWAVGVLADQVRDVTEVYSHEIEPPPNMGGMQFDRSSLSGLARQEGKLILLLDINSVFPEESSPMSMAL